MRMIKSVGLIVLGVALGIAGTTLTPRIKAQAVTEVAPGQVIQPGQPAGTIVTGENIGFQLVATPAKRGPVRGLRGQLLGGFLGIRGDEQADEAHHVI